jgi:hypothetical protein
MKATIVVDQKGNLVAMELGAPAAPSNGPQTGALQAEAGQALHEVDIPDATVQTLTKTNDHATILRELKNVAPAINLTG